MNMKLWMLAGGMLAAGLGTMGQLPDAWDVATLDANGVKVADWMLAHPRRANHNDWTYGAFYAGLSAFGLANPSRPYLGVLREEGTKYAWQLERRPFHADSHCIGQTWLELARFDDNPAALAPTRSAFDHVLANRNRAPLAQRMPRGISQNFDRWCWCDALFMAPAVWAKLAAMTGEEKYRDFMISEYRATHARLFDKDAHLFYRDSNFLDRKTKNGSKVFWGRGDGWVMAGLPLVIRELPDNLRTRPWFVDLFKEMSVALKACQRPDGAWGANLLDAQDPDLPEMSGTCFFCYAMMWGINNGILDSAEYLPCVRKAWTAICRCTTEEGMVGWVQAVADRPAANFGADSTEVYAAGGFLLAATEIRKHAVLAAHADAKRVTVAPVAAYRVDTVTVPWPQPGLSDKDLVVFDERDGAFLPYQLWDDNGDGKPDQLLFVSTFVAGVTRSFRLFNDAKLPKPDLTSVCFGRYAPDRLDDYLWENDKTAWRIYGPGVSQPPPKGEGLISSGVDVWSKKVSYPIIDKWLKIGHYHTDVGEGMDTYKVGTARGCGGFAIWRGGKAYCAGNWKSQKRLATGPVRTAFEVTYAPVDCEGVTVEEKRVITLDRGRRFTRHVATFTVKGPYAVVGGPGLNIAKAKEHNGELTLRPDQGWLANFEPPMKGGKGSLLTAIFTEGESQVATTKEGDLLLVRPIASGKPFTWWAGQGWTGRGEILNADDWAQSTAREQSIVQSPISVTVH